MGKLKLFISHSSRLDDVPHKYTSADHNWKLLEDTCSAIKARYGDRIDVLVDRNGLIPGEDWNHQLNLWLSECHAAIIIFSKRAIDKSNWVAKEAAILSWRAELNDKFSLFPVTIKGESSVDELSRDFPGTLKIDVNQCIRDIESADDIVTGFAQKFGEPHELSSDYPRTPLEKLQGGISKLLTDQTTPSSIIDALAALHCDIPADGTQHIERFANLLAVKLLSSHANSEDICFNIFKTCLEKLAPQPTEESASYLYKVIRPLWVDSAAASNFPMAFQHQKLLVMFGPLVNYTDTQLKTECYTLKRCMERAWPGSDDYQIVTQTYSSSVENIHQDIKNKVLGNDFPPFIDEATVMDNINNSGTKIILIITYSSDTGGLADPRKLETFKQMYNNYQNIIIVFSSIEATQPPEILTHVKPTEDQQLEYDAYTAERNVHQYLINKYT